MFAVAFAALLICQTALEAKPLSNAERTVRLKTLLAPIHLSDPVAPIVKEALERPVTLSFDKAPLDEVVKKLSPMLGGNIQLDANPPGGEDEDGKPLPTTVTFKCKSVPLKDALEAMLKPIKFSYRFTNEAIEIGSLDLIERCNEWRIYPVADVIGARIAAPFLIRNIQDTIERDIWEPNGGECQIQPCPGDSLLVGCGAETHRMVAEYFLSKRRTLFPSLEWAEALDLGEAPPLEGHRAIFLKPSEDFLRSSEAALRIRHDFDIRDATIDDALKQIERIIGLPIKVDDKSLAKEQTFAATRVTIVRRGIRARTALGFIEQYGVSIVETPTGLLAFGEDDEHRPPVHYSPRLYPTGDLLGFGIGPVGLSTRLPREWNRYLLRLVQEYSDDGILCFNRWPDWCSLDHMLLTGHLYHGPRREHRRFEQLYAGIGESLRRRTEILRLTGASIAN